MHRVDQGYRILDEAVFEANRDHPMVFLAAGGCRKGGHGWPDRFRSILRTCPTRVFGVASEDLGPVANGGQDNFGLAQIVLEEGAHVTLLNYVANSGDGPEAIYCDELTLAAGAVLNLNGHTLYVAGELVEAGSKLYGDGTIIEEFRGTPGDVNGDGVVNMSDASWLVGVLLDTDTNAARIMAGDVNGDSDTDARDIEAFIDLLLK